MATTKKHKTLLQEAIVPLVLIGIVGFIAAMYFFGSTQQSPSIVTKATRPTFLTPGDDVLSLEADLDKLKVDPGIEQQAKLEAIQ